MSAPPAPVPVAARVPGWAAPATLAAGLALFFVLAVIGFWNTSATWDEPMHLTAGYAALAAGDFRVDPSHPPLLRMWAALPVVALHPRWIGTAAIDAAPSPAEWLPEGYAFAHRFTYVDNDADRMLRPARIMILVLALLLGAMVFCWTYEWLGLGAAAVALGLFVVEPNLLTHGSLVTTDLGVTTFTFGAVYFLWRACRRLTVFNVGALSLCCALALASKFSAVVLAPILVVLLAAAVRRHALSWRAAAAIAAVAATVSVAVIWAGYGFRYLPSETAAWRFDFAATDMAARAPRLAAVLAWIDEHRLLPNAYVQGFLYTQVSSQQLPSFLAGRYSTSGWWYYFPVAFLIKTPVALLLLLALGLATAVTKRRWWTTMPAAFVAVPALVFLGIAMYSRINIGLRHILPIYPFLLLLATAGAAVLMMARRRLGPVVLALLLLAGTAEFAAAYPHTLPFFNRFVGGPANGFKYLADSNLDWGQNLKALKTWMDEHDVSHINLAYFGQADPAYYHIDATHLPGAPQFANDLIARPRLPGYVAISPTILNGVYAPPQWRLWYRPFEALEPVAVLGHALRIYRVDDWPEAIGPAGRTDDPTAHRALADALLFGMRWPERAALHYREHLRAAPDDGSALLNLGTALAVAGRGAEAIPPLERGVAVRPGDANAQDLLGRVLAAEGHFDKAAVAFREALRIDPSHTGARDHLARVVSR